ncbi:MAG: T9SS type A sorting domain-containing protein [Verrucomicrobiota bacterium]
MLTTLDVYDITGRRITQLVNATIIPGTYKVNFDGSNYSSGIYFYTLSSGNYKETKKMVLVK